MTGAPVRSNGQNQAHATDSARDMAIGSPVKQAARVLLDLERRNRPPVSRPGEPRQVVAVRGGCGRGVPPHQAGPRTAINPGSGKTPVADPGGIHPPCPTSYHPSAMAPSYNSKRTVFHANRRPRFGNPGTAHVGRWGGQSRSSSTSTGTTCQSPPTPSASTSIVLPSSSRHVARHWSGASRSDRRSA